MKLGTTQGLKGSRVANANELKADKMKLRTATEGSKAKVAKEIASLKAGELAKKARSQEVKAQSLLPKLPSTGLTTQGKEQLREYQSSFVRGFNQLSPEQKEMFASQYKANAENMQKHGETTPIEVMRERLRVLKYVSGIEGNGKIKISRVANANELKSDKMKLGTTQELKGSRVGNANELKTDKMKLGTTQGLKGLRVANANELKADKMKLRTATEGSKAKAAKEIASLKARELAKKSRSQEVKAQSLLPKLPSTGLTTQGKEQLREYQSSFVRGFNQLSPEQKEMFASQYKANAENMQKHGETTPIEVMRERLRVLKYVSGIEGNGKIKISRVANANELKSDKMKLGTTQELKGSRVGNANELKSDKMKLGTTQELKGSRVGNANELKSDKMKLRNNYRRKLKGSRVANAKQIKIR